MLFARRRSKPTAYVISETAPANTVGEGVRISAKGPMMRQSQRARMRIMMCAVVFVFVFASLGVRLSYVSFGDIAPRRVATADALASLPRPELVDRNGAILATDLPMVTLEVAGREVWDADETATALAGVLPDIDAGVLAAKLSQGRYVEVSNDLTPAKRQAVFDLGLPGVHFSTRSRRFYPQADLAAHIIGHGEPGKGGVMGLERAINGRPAEKQVRASIDIRAQQALEGELGRAIEKFSAKAAWGGVIDVRTGEVIALASLPDFDPNSPGASPEDARRNRATYDRYELGSAFKAFTAAAALETGVATENATYDARKPFKVADRFIRDYRGKNRVLTFSEVVQHSSNIGAARIAGDLGPARQKEFLEALGLFEPLDIELAENRAPELPGQWGPVEAATISYGHGISVTPLHLLAGFAAVVNGGAFHTPTFFAVDETTEGKRVFSTKTSTIMRRVLRRVVIDGSASQAEAQGYFPIGKTATADKPENGGYNRDARIASFIGAMPGHAPEYAILISLDEPQALDETHGFATAGWNAAPAFASLVERLAPILGVTPVNEADALRAFSEGMDATYREARLDEIKGQRR